MHNGSIEDLLHKLFQIPLNSQSPLGVLKDREMFVGFSLFLVKFYCIAWGALNVLSSQIFHHNSILLIVPRISFFVEDLVVGVVMSPNLVARSIVCKLFL